MLGRASINMPSTEKYSSDGSSFARGRFSIVAMNLAAVSPDSRRCCGPAFTAQAGPCFAHARLVA
jgi:hypothetical protein